MESNNCEMVANSGLEDEEIELELGLSIGGSYRRQNATELKSVTSTFDMGSREKLQTLIRSSISVLETTASKTKREIHALRRQEANKKREAKQLKNDGFCKGYLNGGQVINNGENINNNNNNNSEISLKAKAFQSKEREIKNEEPECKKSKIEDIGSDHNDSSKVNLNQKNNGTCYSSPCSSSILLPAVLAVEYGHPPLQYGAPANGFVYPCANLNVLPCWFTTGEEKNLVRVQPVVSYGFVPFQAVSDRGRYLGNGYDSEQNGSHDGGNTKVGTNRFLTCASSTSSDHRCSYHEGGGSSYTRSRSSPSVQEQPQLNNDSKENDAKGQSEHSATSQLTESTNNVENKLVQSSLELKEEVKVESDSNITNKNPSPSMDSKSELGKPPKPQAQLDHSNPSLPYMPCVSTTGNGPNGKTINGFLYRYTKTEVSIICVCHGSSFSPAEFVKHAGGTDVSHPLKHITVIPSAF